MATNLKASYEWRHWYSILLYIQVIDTWICANTKIAILLVWLYLIQPKQTQSCDDDGHKAQAVFDSTVGGVTHASWLCYISSSSPPPAPPVVLSYTLITITAGPVQGESVSTEREKVWQKNKNWYQYTISIRWFCSWYRMKSCLTATIVEIRAKLIFVDSWQVGERICGIYRLYTSFSHRGRRKCQQIGCCIKYSRKSAYLASHVGFQVDW